MCSKIESVTDIGKVNSDKVYPQNVDLRSGLAYIDIKEYDNDPIKLFKSWFEEAKRSDLVMPTAACLATASRDGQQVTARHLLLRRLDNDNGFVIMTDKRSKKCRHMAENPNVSMSFLWNYKKDNKVISRQVRIDGTAEELDRSDYIDLYESQPLYCKVRAHLCHQGKVIDNWNELKLKHDILHNNFVEEGKVLEMPDHFIAYKVHPKMIEFYGTTEYEIADRAMFLLQEDGSWLWKRIAA